MVGDRDFFFRCQRSGNCCRVGTGRVWLEEGELQAIADALGMSAQGFADQHVVAVGDRVSLRERSDGRCVLLEGQCHCTVYASRPEQCRDYPDWPILRDDPAAFARAAEYCPGIQLLPTPAQQAAGRQALMEVLPEPQPDVDGIAPCLRAGEAARPVSSLETDAFLEAFSDASEKRGEPCPALSGQACQAGAARPAICRNLSPEQGYRVEREIQTAAENCGYPWSKADWTVILPDRAAAWHASARSPLDV